MRFISTVLAVVSIGCAAGGGINPEGHVPVSWSLGITDAPDGKTSIVCEFQQARPCVIPRGTDEKPKYASFRVRVWGPPTTKFTGSLVVTYLSDPDPRHYVSPVNLTSSGKEINYGIFSKITSAPGQYSARGHLEETHDGAPPRTHEFDVPVTVE